MRTSITNSYFALKICIDVRFPKIVSYQLYFYYITFLFYYCFLLPVLVPSTVPANKLITSSARYRCRASCQNRGSAADAFPSNQTLNVFNLDLDV